nr:carboxypeptidase-like regulatory domain-containing protein [Robertkochia marina]
MLLLPVLIFSQEERAPIRGKVMYMNTNVPNENVINVTSAKATVTDDNGEFMIEVMDGDVLAFTSLNYQFKTITITPEMIQKNRLVVTVDEKVTELDEVVITPENRERFLELKGEEFKKVDYQTDMSTRVQNTALPLQDRGMQYGLNFVNIFKALFNVEGENAENAPQVKVSEILRQVYDDEFFVADLQIPQDKIDEFLFYVDEKTPPRELLRKSNEFQLIDYLVNQSKAYNQLLAEQN